MIKAQDAGLLRSRRALNETVKSLQLKVNEVVMSLQPLFTLTGCSLLREHEMTRDALRYHLKAVLTGDMTLRSKVPLDSF